MLRDVTSGANVATAVVPIFQIPKGPFKYYVMKEVGEWGQKMAIFDDLQYCTSSKIWVGGRA